MSTTASVKGIVWESAYTVMSCASLKILSMGLKTGGIQFLQISFKWESPGFFWTFYVYWGYSCGSFFRLLVPFCPMSFLQQCRSSTVSTAPGHCLVSLSILLVLFYSYIEKKMTFKICIGQHQLSEKGLSSPDCNILICF